MNTQRIGPLWTHVRLALYGAAPVVAIFIALYCLPNERTARLAGVTLEVLGLFVAVRGLTEIREKFGLQGLREWFCDLRLILSGSRQVHTVTGDLKVRLSSVSGQGYGTIGPRPGATVEQRIDLLEQVVNGLTDGLSFTRGEILKEIRERQDAIDKEARARETEVRRIDALLRDSVAGGAHIELLGLAWLFAGLIVSAIAPEFLPGGWFGS